MAGPLGTPQEGHSNVSGKYKCRPVNCKQHGSLTISNVGGEGEVQGQPVNCDQHGVHTVIMGFKSYLFVLARSRPILGLRCNLSSPQELV